MKKIIIILHFFVVQQAISQTKTIFKETFKNNHNQWALYNDTDFIVKISQGKLQLQKLEKNRIRNGCLWYSKAIPGLNTARDFSIIFYARVISYGDIFDAIDMQWGTARTCDSCNVTGELYQLDIAPKGVRLSYFSDKGGWKYFDWSTSIIEYQNKKTVRQIPYRNIIQKNNFNKYEINQINDSVFVRVNNIPVHQLQIQPISGNGIGIQQCLKNAWEIDKLIIRQ